MLKTAWYNMATMCAEIHLLPTGSMAQTLGKLNPFRYRGYVWDDETGLFYVGARYYDPVTSRWLSLEPSVDVAEFDKGAGLFKGAINSNEIHPNHNQHGIHLQKMFGGLHIGNIRGSQF